MYEDLSDKQVKILNFIKEQIYNKGYPPSVREICKAVGLKSTSTVHSHLNKLVEKKYIKKGNNKNRAIELINSEVNKYDTEKKEMASLPLIGDIAAGTPILAYENVEDVYPIPIDWVGKEESFMLQVKGDSMMDVGIFNGDYVIISRQNTAQNGQIVAALIEDEATLKTFHREKNHIRLQPENKNMDPIISDQVDILGVLKCVIRRY